MRHNSILFLALLSLWGLLSASCQKQLSDTTLDKIDLKITKLATTTRYFSDIKYDDENIFSISQTRPSRTDATRLRTALSHSDINPTGLKPASGQQLIVEVTFHGASNTKPKLIIGTPELDAEQIITLNAGTNTITPTLIKNMYLKYTSETPVEADSITVTFIDGYIKSPFFKSGSTTLSEWNTQLSQQTDVNELVTLIGEKHYILVSRQMYNNFISINPQLILDNNDTFIALQNDISGLDNSTALHMEPDGKVCFIEKSSGYLNATHGGLVRATGISAWKKILSPKNIVPGSSASGWGSWHEVGHLHQLWPITPYTVIGEAAPNIYAGYVNKIIDPPYVYVSGTKWTQAKSYLAQPDGSKNLQTLDNFAKLVMFEQLSIAFGDEFMRKLHKLVREEIGITYPLPNKNVTNVAERLGALAYYSSKAAQRNLTEFFQKWGCNLSSSTISLINSLNYPSPTTDIWLINSDDKIIDGAFYSFNAYSNNQKLLAVKNSQTSNGTFVELGDNTTIDNSKLWLARKINSTEYNFKTRLDTSKVMAVAAAANADGTPVRIWTYDNGPAQRWAPSEIGIGIFKFTPACAKSRRLDINGGAMTNGTKIQIWSSSEVDSQKFIPTLQF